MKPNKHIRTIYIRKKREPLILADYEVRLSSHTGKKVSVEPTQWELYTQARKEFLTVWEQVRAARLEGEVPESLFYTYRDVRAKFFIQHLIVNEEFSKYAS